MSNENDGHKNERFAQPGAGTRVTVVVRQWHKSYFLCFFDWQKFISNLLLRALENFAKAWMLKRHRNIATEQEQQQQ